MLSSAFNSGFILALDVIKFVFTAVLVAAAVLQF